MDGNCTATFSGTLGGTYYIPCDTVSDFDDALVYYGDTPFYIYDDINHQGHSLYVQPACTPAYKNNDDLWVYISPADVSFNDRAIWYRSYSDLIVFCLILLCAFRAITIFRR